MKRLVISLIMLLSTLALAACGAEPTATPVAPTLAPTTAAPTATAAAAAAPTSTTAAAAAPTSTTAAASGNRQTVNLWTYYGDAGSSAQCIAQAGADFDNSQSQYHLAIRNIPFSQFNNEVTTALAAGTTPDLMIVDNPDNARYASVGSLADLTSSMAALGGEKAYYPGPYNSTVWQGKNYGIPLGSNTLVLWINSDMAAAAGLDINNPPKTWDDFMTWAAKLTNKDKGIYGTALLAKRDETGTFEFLPWMYQNGGDIKDLSSPEAVAALQYWTDLVNKGYAPKDAINDGFPEIYQQFTTGKAAMMVSGTWNVTTIGKDAPNLKWTVAELPYSKQPASGLGGENWAVFANAKSPDGAKAFLSFTQNPDYVEKLYSCMGYLPSRTNVGAKIAASADATTKVFLAQLQTAKARGPLPNWSDISAPIQVAMQEALSGQKSPQQAMGDAAKIVTPLLSGAQ